MKSKVASSVVWEGTILLPYWKGGERAFALPFVPREVDFALERGDFQGALDETAWVYFEKGAILLVGLGEEKESSAESLRRSFGAAWKAVLSKKKKEVFVVLPSTRHVRGAIEGVYFANYKWDRYKTPKESSSLVESVVFVGKVDEVVCERGKKIAAALEETRDLVLGNADEVTPSYLVEKAKGMKKLSEHLHVTIRDRLFLEKEGMGLILAVARGSQEEPYLIEMEYKGNPSSKDEVALVGKGVTYDTGGLALKPAEGMVAMRMDMAGAAAVLGTMHAVALLGLPVNVRACIPVVENAIGPKSYKNGDVYVGYSKKSVEINNTDAEGRLILADALAYVIDRYHPKKVIDLATLTGNMVVSLGEEFAGVFSNTDSLAKELLAASSRSGELLWQMPLYREYLEAYKSDVADIANCGGKEAGAIKAALFLHEFVGKTSWAHLDIAGPAFLSKAKYYHPVRATGYGVRLLVEFLSA